MKTKYLLIFFTCIASLHQGIAQTPIEKLATDYLGISPYGISVDSFISVIHAKHSLYGDWAKQKTKDTLGYFNGFSDSFNPFSIQVTKVEFQVRESLVVSGKAVRDTIWVFQIIGLADTTQQAKELVRSEYKKIKKLCARWLKNVRTQSKKSKGSFLFESSLFSQSVQTDIITGWGVHYADNKTYAISVRFILRRNSS